MLGQKMWVETMKTLYSEKLSIHKDFIFKKLIWKEDGGRMQLFGGFCGKE